MKTVVQFGAGNIGRGFLGQLYSQSGWAITYIDVNPEVVALMNERHGFDIDIVGPDARTVHVTNVSAVNGRDIDAVAEAIDKADLLGTAVGVNAIKFIIPALAAGLTRRAARGAGIDMVICENMLDSSVYLGKLLHEAMPEHADFLANQLGLVETVVSRMIPPLTPEERARDPLGIAVESFGILPVARKAFRHGVPDITGFDPTDDIHAVEERKLFCHNCMHAMASYFGAQKGMTHVWEAVEDADICAKVRAGGWESGEALMRKHGFSHETMKAHIDDLLARFANKALRDTVARCGGDPIRKLGRRDRLIGAALLALEYGVKPTILIEAIHAALQFCPEGDVSAPTLQKILHEEGLPVVLSKVCGLEATEPLFDLIIAEK